MLVKITICTDNDAFQCGPCHETARILREYADRLDAHAFYGAEFPRDINGNKVGTVELDFQDAASYVAE